MIKNRTLIIVLIKDYLQDMLIQNIENHLKKDFYQLKKLDNLMMNPVN